MKSRQLKVQVFDREKNECKPANGFPKDLGPLPIDDAIARAKQLIDETLGLQIRTIGITQDGDVHSVVSKSDVEGRGKASGWVWRRPPGQRKRD